MKRRAAVTIRCPACDKVVVARTLTQEIFEREGSFHAGWRVERETYVCPTCAGRWNAEHFSNDGTGVLLTRTWTCRHCQTETSVSFIECSVCGQRCI